MMLGSRGLRGGGGRRLHRGDASLDHCDHKQRNENEKTKQIAERGRSKVPRTNDDFQELGDDGWYDVENTNPQRKKNNDLGMSGTYSSGISVLLPWKAAHADCSVPLRRGSAWQAVPLLPAAPVALWSERAFALATVRAPPCATCTPIACARIRAACWSAARCHPTEQPHTY